jgi:hypothetical protein
MPSEIDLYHELTCYTLTHPDQHLFIHQYAVDAFAAQHSRENVKTITTAFALVGLYLFAHRSFTGKEVQRAHMHMAKNKKQWPRFEAPAELATMSVADVLKAKPGQARDDAIKKWAHSVWNIWQHEQSNIAALIPNDLPKSTAAGG